MSKEGHQITRRQALQEMGLLGAAGLAAQALTVVDGAVLGAKTAYGLAADVQPGVAEQIIPFPEKGWLETSVPSRGPFITASNGHKEYLRKLCINNDVLADVTVRSYNKLFERDSNRPSYTMGEMLLEHVDTARESLTRMRNTGNVPWEEALHLGILSLAAVLSHYFKPEELRNRGVAILRCYQSDYPITLVPEYYQKIPKIYPADPQTCSTERLMIAGCYGGDRSHHVANNLALTYQYLYAKKYGLQDAERIPSGMKWLFKLIPNRTVRKEAIALDRTAQWFWEAKESKDTTFGTPGDFSRDENGKIINSGFWDDKIWHDFKANELGLWAALELSKDNITEEDIKDVARQLDYPSIYLMVPDDGRLFRSEMLDIFRSPQPPTPDVVVYANLKGISALPLAV